MRKTNLGSLFFIIALSSMNASAKTDKCDMYKKSFTKAEVKTNELLNNGKASSVRLIRTH
mgnify:CR=1 FL=1